MIELLLRRQRFPELLRLAPEVRRKLWVTSEHKQEGEGKTHRNVKPREDGPWKQFLEMFGKLFLTGGGGSKTPFFGGSAHEVCSSLLFALPLWSSLDQWSARHKGRRETIRGLFSQLKSTKDACQL